MSIRTSIITIVLALLLAPSAEAKQKKKQVLPDYVLKAQRVLVVIYPDAGEPLTNPAANRTAREDVETALMQWGRYHLVLDSITAELVIAVRKGHAGGTVIRNSPSDYPPVTSQGIDGETRVGVRVGRPPDVTEPGPGPTGRTGPHIGTEAGPSEDLLEVYRGGTDYPLDAPPVWRYTGKDALKAPHVKAIEEFQKAIEEAVS